MDRKSLARAAGEAMARDDRCSRSLGMKLEEIAPGYARMTMRVTREMVNGLGTCHGGMIYTLADSTFGFACNSHNHRAVATTCTIEYLSPAKLGDVLTAVGAEQALVGRFGVYDMRVTNQEGAVIALFRGKSTIIKGRVVEL
jgi:acyl-CoA thioesterase